VRYWIRNFVYAAILFALLPWIVWRSVKTGRYRAGWRQKLFGLDRHSISDFASRAEAVDSPTIWLHGVSVGEVQLIVPLLNRMRAQHPDARFAVSTTTESGWELAKKLLPADVLLFYFPLDFSWAVRRTLATLDPALIVLGELELWPNLMDAAHARDVPVAIVNGRLSQRSYAGYRRLAWLTRPMLAKLSLVAAQSETYAQRFRACGASRTTEVTGSIKFDNVVSDRSCASVESLRQLVGIAPSDRVWVVGSTQAPEELAAAQAWQQLRSQFATLKLIVVPRHPDRFDEVFHLLGTLDARVVRRSSLHAAIPNDAWDILLVDTVGELKWWWGLAEIALVGGSFGTRGGQNMLEPAAFGANVAFGPNTANFRDIVDLLLAGDAAVCLPTLAELEPWLRQELNDPQAGQARGRRAQAIVARQQGALERTVTALNQLFRRQETRIDSLHTQQPLKSA
jgi:3-deoxy-D-manno-octulosonic-acid transferase